METKKLNQLIMNAIGELSPESRPFIANIHQDVSLKKNLKNKLKKTAFNF